MALERMEREGLDFSMLFTGAHGHYSALGWERVPNPSLTLRLPREDPAFSTDIHEMVRKDWDALTELWLKSPRPLRLQRSPEYTAGWCSWEWRNRGARVFVLPERGYAVVSESKRDGDTLIVEDWASDSSESEVRLLRHAAALARAVGRSKVRLAKMPVSSTAAIAELGSVEPAHSSYMMLRNVALPPDRYCAVVDAYSTGAAAWWPSDDF